MGALTEEQRTRYLEDGGAHCPFCGSEDFLVGDVDEDSADPRYNVDLHCNACGGEWVNCYELVDVQDLVIVEWPNIPSVPPTQPTVLVIPDHEADGSEGEYPGGILPGAYSRNQVVELLRRHADNPEAVRFMADMLEE